MSEELCCELGEEVGYMVRGDSKCTGITRLAFCTYGVLLRRLQSDPYLEGIDYVILDEVHERGVDSDFALALLVTALGDPKSYFKLILMSATISTDKFASYLGDALVGKYHPKNCRGKRGFNNGIRGPPAAILSIPGYTHDVEMFYKSDYEQLLRGDSTTTSPFLSNNYKSGDSEEDHAMDCTDGPVHMEIKRYHPSTDTFRIGGPLFKGDIDWDLLVRLTMKLATGEDQPAAAHSTDKRGISIQSMFQRASGSVLIFLPGVPEITRYLQYLRQEWDKLDHKLGNGKPARLITMPLHGGLSAADQKQVFIPAKSGELKIVAATNVAEASITIPDVSVVIDTCKVKEMYFVPDKQMNALITKFASHDSLRQRRGRAGRVSTGRCFRLVTEGTYDKFSPNGTPEILRVSVDDLILQIKAMQEVRAKQGGERESCMQVLSRCPDPPTSTAVLTSESILTKIQALDGDGGITPLAVILRRYLAHLR